jgi:Putative Ig domain
MVRPPVERPLGWRWLPGSLGFAVALLSPRCVSVSIDARDCQIPCAASCPSGFECSRGYCVRDPERADCPAPGAPDLDAGRRELPESSPDSGDAGPSLRVADACSPGTGLQLSPCPPPAPCRGVPYAIDLSASGGVAPYAWSASALPAGMSLSSEGELRGTLTQSGTLTFRVRDSSSDGSGVERSHSFELVPRDRCWLAYAGNDEETPYVELVDTLLDPSVPSRVRLPAGMGEEVVDFQFSPDGRALAVRMRDPLGLARLTLYGAPQWSQLELSSSVERSVLHYAWAIDSSMLALGVSDGDRTFLETLRLSAEVTAGDGALSRSVLSGAAVEAPIDSELVWFANDRVAFHAPSEAPGPPGQRRVYHSELGPASAFLVPVAHQNATPYVVDALSTLRLQPAEAGLFVVSSFAGTAGIDFHPADSSSTIYGQAPLAIISPHGRFTTLSTEQGELRVYPPEGVDALAALDGCSHFIAWSSAEDRLACVTNDVSFGGLGIFDFDGSSLTRSFVEGRYAYSEEAALTRRRAFSPSGTRFAFTTDSSLFVAELESDRWLVERAATAFYAASTPFADLAFSPDERWLLMHRGNTLMLRDLSSIGDDTAVIEMGLPLSEACAEVEGDTSHRWCGDASSQSAAMAWSRDSTALAYRALEADARPALHASVNLAGLALLRCGPGCAHYAFQP